MAIADDLRVDANGDIRYIGAAHEADGAGYYTVLELHRFLQELADDAVALGDDWLDIISETPSERSTDGIITLNGSYNIDQALSEHLYGGTIVQGVPGNQIRYDGIVNYGTKGMILGIIQDGELYDNDFWNNTPFGETDAGLNPDDDKGISHRFLLQVGEAGNDIDDRRFVAISREWGYTYSEYVINGTILGDNVIALSREADPYNTTDEATVAGWTDITNTEALANIDVNADGDPEFYYSEWDLNGHTQNELYERLKYLTRYEATDLLYGMEGRIFRGITHASELTNLSGTFQVGELVEWGGGNGRLLAIRTDVGDEEMWLQVMWGDEPEDGQALTGETSAASADAVGDPDPKPISAPIMSSTGDTITGSYGLGVEAEDMRETDRVVDLYENIIMPPNYVTFSVTNLNDAQDRVLVAPYDGSAIQFNQLALDGAHTAGSATVTVTANIPSDTPSSGTIRVYDGTKYVRVEYGSYEGKVFSGCTGVPDAADAANVFISYIDKVADGTSEDVTMIFASNRDVLVRVRNGAAAHPFKTFESTASISATGGTVVRISTPDA